MTAILGLDLAECKGLGRRLANPRRRALECRKRGTERDRRPEVRLASRPIRYHLSIISSTE